MDDNKYHCTVIERKFNKSLMNKKGYENFEKSSKSQICKKTFNEADVQVKVPHYWKILRINTSRL